MAVDPRRRPPARVSARRAPLVRPAKDDQRRAPRLARKRPKREARGFHGSRATNIPLPPVRRDRRARRATARAVRRARGRSFERQGAVKSRLRFCTPEPEPPRSSEPILIPKLRIGFADFPYLHYSMRLEAAHLGDLLRISVRTGAKTPRGPLPDFHGPRGDHGHRRSERCSSRSRPYLPASGFQGRTTLTEKRELFPDPPAASPGSFRLPGRGTRQRRRREDDERCAFKGPEH